MRTIRVALALATLGFFAAAPAHAADKAKRTFDAKCASCHGEDGKGQTTKGKEMKISDMSSQAWQKATSDEKIKEAIDNGVHTTKDGVKQEMEAYKDKLKPEQVDALVKYIRTLGK